MKQIAQRFRERMSLPQGTRTGPLATYRPVSINSRSASLTVGCSPGRLRKYAKKNRHHTKATEANTHIAWCQFSPPSSTMSTQIRGVRPPRKRALIQMIDLAKPRCEAGNQL